ncbi:hypothetical protein H2203_002313 [Taxawa tesnikishii (nom. ined.)]|nr:hypothetical protein H2203_002313 [Dothideales sp. JES 119]
MSKEAFILGPNDEPETYWAFKELVGKRPNKQERNRVDRYRRKGLRARAMKRRERREDEENWISNALRDASAKKKYLDEYGIGKHCLTQSIKKLDDMFKGAGGDTLQATTGATDDSE